MIQFSKENENLHHNRREQTISIRQQGKEIQVKHSLLDMLPGTLGIGQEPLQQCTRRGELRGLVLVDHSRIEVLREPAPKAPPARAVGHEDDI